MHIEDFKLKCSELFSEKQKADEMKEDLKLQNKRVEELKKVITDYMNDADLPNFDTGFGKVIRTDRTSAKCVDKPALKLYLKEQGLFDDLASVNSQTLNALYREKLQTAVEQGDVDFGIPGVEASIFQTIQLRGIKNDK